jgi:hypothetical protein
MVPPPALDPDGTTRSREPPGDLVTKVRQAALAS